MGDSITNSQFQSQQTTSHANQIHQSHDSPQPVIDNFLKRINFLINKMVKISSQTDNQQKRITELRGLVFMKPHIQEAISVQNLLKNTHPDFSRDILPDLTSDIELSLRCLQNLRNFYQTKKSLSQTEIMRQTKHIIESTWQQVYRLSIYDPVLIDELSKLEWIYRARDVLSQNRANTSYPFIEYCELLKKGAIESQSEEIMGSKLYKRIEEELKRHQSLIKKVRSIDSAEKMDVEKVRKIVKELKEYGFGMKQEVKPVEEILKRASKIEKEFDEVLKNRFSASQNDFEELTLQIQNFPLKFLRIEGSLKKLENDQKGQVKVILQKTAQRINEKNNELHRKLLMYAEQGTMIPKEVCEEMENIKEFSAELIQKLPTFKFEDFCLTTKQSTDTPRGYEHIKAELWLAKMKILQIFCKGIVKPLKSITFEQFYSFLFEIKDFIDCLPGPERIPFDQQISFLEDSLQEISAYIAKEQDEQEKRVFYGFIDATKEMIESVQPVQIKFNTQIHLNQKRSRTDNETEAEEIDSYEKIEKKMKKENDIAQLVKSSSSEKEEFQSERAKIEISDHMENDLEEIPKKEEDMKNEPFEEKLEDQKDLNSLNEEVLEKPSEKIKKAQEFWNKLNNEKLFDEIFALENNSLGKSGLDSNSLLDRFNKEFWNDLDGGLEFKKKEELKKLSRVFS